MIVSSPYTVNHSDIDITRDEYENIIEGIENSPFTTDRSYGFILDEIEPDQLTANLVFRSATTIQDYDVEAEEVVSVEQKRTDLIPFAIDFQRGLLSTFSNKDNTKKLVTRLSSLGNWNISINPLSLNLSEVYDEISQSSFDTRVTGLRISDFSINEYTSGSYHLKVFEEHEAQRLLNEYKSNVSYLTVEYDKNRQPVTIGFYDSGSVQIYSNSSKDDAIFNHIKNVMDGVGGLDNG